jgi:starch-binding outer membrane protein, SusD/RagB family
MKHVFRGLALAAALVGAAACNADRLDIPNYNAPTTEGVAKDPQGIQLSATGMILAERNLYFARVRDVAVFGREGYFYFPTDARFVSNALVGVGTPPKLDPNGFYSGNWNGPFAQLRNAKNLIDATTASALSDAQKKATTGFAKTFKALALMHILETRDSLGTPVEVNDNPNDFADFVSRDSAFKYISALLDEAKTELQAGGATFPFVLTAGFTGFTTPTEFIKVNRALAARNLVYRGVPRVGCGATCYTQALAALNESFTKTPVSFADLDIGAYNNFSTATGDVVNGLNYEQNLSMLAHASYATDAQKKAGGASDDRFTRKVVKLATPVAAPQDLGVPAEYRFNIYANGSSPTPVIRNEELVLMRAEARWFTGDKANAVADLNAVRAVSGGLGASAVTAGSTDAQFIQALLYERRYSLMLEGFRWVDFRRFNLLQTLPKDLPTHFIAIVEPIPVAECDARRVKPNGC